MKPLGIGTRILTLAWMALAVVLSAYLLLQQLRAWPLVDLAARLESGATYRQFPAPEGTLTPSAQLGILCDIRLQRARVTVRLARLDAVSDFDTFAHFDSLSQQAVDEIRQLLLCNPYDGNGWLRLAMVETERQGPTADSIEALRLSYKTSPHEIWIMRSRIPFAQRLAAAGIDGIMPQAEAELDLFISKAFTRDIAMVLVATPPAARAQFIAKLKALDAERYRQIYRALTMAGPEAAKTLPAPAPRS